jgi:membrane-bound ClpP family serine protease
MKNGRFIIAVITSLIDEMLILGLILWGLPKFGVEIPLPITIVILTGFAIWAVTTYKLGTRILKKKPLAGLTDMTSVEGRVVKSLNPTGLIKIEGEIWNAQSKDGNIENGTDVIVISQDGFRLTVKRKEKLTS